MFLKMTTTWRAQVGIIHLVAEGLKEIKQGKSGKTQDLMKIGDEMTVVEVVVVLLYLKEFYVVDADEMMSETGHSFSHASYPVI